MRDDGVVGVAREDAYATRIFNGHVMDVIVDDPVLPDHGARIRGMVIVHISHLYAGTGDIV